MPVLLDTTVLIDVLRGNSAAGRLLGLRSSGEIPFLCCINVEEIWRGLRPREEEAAGQLLEGLRLAELGLAEGRRAGRWRREAAARGSTLSQADCLIAAAALGVGARLATGNPKHFPMEELEVEHWPAGG
ncbi:MAG: PIN domain-containing protein [Thermoleophilaceae bacterium]